MVKFSQPIDSIMGDIGTVPLPPYIRKSVQDPDRYQTIFAERTGSAAAPTAGLHFSPGLFAKLSAQGIRSASITLHIGLDTFGPVKVDDPKTHPIHTEWCSVSSATTELVNYTHASGGRVVAVGTTSVRALETTARATLNQMSINPYEGYHGFIYSARLHLSSCRYLIDKFSPPSIHTADAGEWFCPERICVGSV